MCPLCTQLRALSTWAGWTGGLGDKDLYHGEHSRRPIFTFSHIFFSYYMERLLNKSIQDHVTPQIIIPNQTVDAMTASASGMSDTSELSLCDCLILD